MDKDATGIPSFITGNLGAAVTGNLSEADVQSIVSAVAPAFRAKASELRFKGAQVDNLNDVHYRFKQFKNGLEVIGGELTVHTRSGVAYAANGNARADLSAPADAKISAQAAIAKASGLAASYVNNLSANAKPELFYYRQDDRLDLVYRTQVTGTETNGTPIIDDIFVNAVDGSVVARHPRIHTARNRELHNLNHGTSLPGPVARTETQGPVADETVNINFGHLGSVYDTYKNDFNWDSFDNQGAKLISSVHYSNNYVNAFWNGTQMVYGDGDNVQASNLAHSLDVTGHELTHAVTERTSNLTYSGESGGLNEAMSDIFGAYIEWVRDGRGTPQNLTTWTVGDDIWTPGTAGDGLRYMYSPTKDTRSLDWYPDYRSGVDVHYSSGIANLAFFLLSQGGTHPRGKSSVNVTGIGIAKAAQVFFRANTTLFQANTNFANAKTLTAQAAQQLGYSTAEVDSVNKAWEAVGVGAVTPPPTATEIFNNTPVTGISSGGTSKTYKYYKINVPSGVQKLTVTTTGASGGSGDADLYVKLGSTPSTTSSDGKSEGSARNESVVINSPATGTWYIAIFAWSSYSGVTLKAVY